MVLRINSKVLWLEILFALMVTIGVVPKAIALSVANSDILWHITSQCVDPSIENYCSQCMLPRRDTHCGGINECKKTNEVWVLNKEYVAIRDIKMCGCPVDFVHGLAMPRDIVTGVEDANRQEGIWKFSWDVAIERMEPSSIALVVNPKSQRTQNQLHVHLVRLDKNAQGNFSQHSPVHVDSLEHVWAAAEKDAKLKELSEYGVLVAQSAPGKYILITTPNSPEAAFTQWACN